MTYLTENPWPLILVLLGTAFVAFLTASSRTGLIAITCVVLSLGLFFLEQFLVSPREEVQAAIHLMLTSFRANDPDAVAKQISPTSPQLSDIAKKGLELVELSPSFHIRSADVTMVNPTTAVALVRANGTVALRKHGGGPRHVATYWKLTWVAETGQWKLKDVRRLNVTNGEEMDYFSASIHSTTPAGAPKYTRHHSERRLFGRTGCHRPCPFDQLDCSRT